MWKEWVDAPTAKETGHILFHAATFDNKENLPDEYIERMAQAYVEGTPMYRQYVLGEFVQMSGLVLPGFDPAKMTGSWPDKMKVREIDDEWVVYDDDGIKSRHPSRADALRSMLFTHKFAGVDFGSQSPTTIIETSMTTSRHIWVREWLYKRECDDETFVKACGEAMKSGITQFICDPSGKDRIEWMVRQGIPAIKAESNKIERRVKAWTTPIAEGRLTVDINSGFLIRELTGLVWAERRGRDLETDRFSQNSPDHAFDGAAYSLMRADRGYADLQQLQVKYVL